MNVLLPGEQIEVTLTVNGRPYRQSVETRTLLSDFIRDHLGLTGTNVGCEHGYCGACTVVIDGMSARSCLTLAASVNGSEIRTVEGLAPDGQTLSDLQTSFQEHHGLQCGFCTSGMLMTATELLESGDELDEESVRRAISGNICRCTGYVYIVDAILAQAAGTKRGHDDD